MQFNAKCDYNNQILTIKCPPEAAETIRQLLGGSPMLSVTLAKPRKLRSAGPGSQNNHIHGHASQIADYTGYDISEVKYLAKVRAEKRGYPMKKHTIKLGIPCPESSASVSTVEAGYLIDELHQIAAELGINLIETEEA